MFTWFARRTFVVVGDHVVGTVRPEYNHEIEHESDV